ncbi:hypothetical protein [Algoriphagus resistens]|uniref:hypothetical protein n=1 Tax=Algoriphagus resistens TaxID=1750590 RepID=UPI000716A406|nr:hypothetical protein [Algoriphagus resistens]
MKYYLSLLLVVALFLQGCSDDNPLSTLAFYWDQTGCADPWNSNANHTNEETQTAVENYLMDEGVIGAMVISITSDGIQMGCEACFCTTGTRINISVPVSQKERMIALGFKESN